MKRGLAVVLVLVVVVLILLWWRGRDQGGAGEGAAPTANSAVAGTTATGSASRGSSRATDPRRGPRKVSGRVVAGDKPVVATVWIERIGRDYQVLGELTTGADGAFELAGLPAGKYLVSASAPDFAGRSVEVDLRSGDKDGVVVRLGICERVLTGLVMEASGGPIAAARVTMRDAFLHDGSLARTGADGRYRLCGPNAQVQLEVRADGYASERRELVPGSAGPDFVLRPEAVLSGVTVDPNGAPVAFALVKIEPDVGTSGRDALGSSTVSDADGAYEVRGLGAGDHHVLARTDTMATPAAVDASIELGVTNTLQLVLHPAGTIRGTAVLANGKPAAGVEIVWLHASAHRALARTDAQGAFAIDGAAYGDGSFFATGYALPEGPKVAGAEPVRLVLPALRDVKVRGRVLASGRPVAEARILVHGVAVYDQGRSRDDGSFEIETIPGRFAVAAESDALGLGSALVPLDVPAGENREGLELVLDRGGAARGTIVDERGVPLSGTAVTLRRVGDVPSQYQGSRMPSQAVADASGAFAVTMLAPGEYTLDVERFHQDLEVVTGPRTVVIDGPAKTVDGIRIVAKFATVTFAGQVVDDAGVSVVDAGLELRAGTAMLVRRAGASGKFRFETPAASKYTLVARGKPGAEAILRDVRPGTNLRVELLGSGRLRLACTPAGRRIRIYTASSAILSGRCGHVLARVPAGPVYARADDVKDGEPVPMALGEVAPGRETTLAIVPVAERDVELRVVKRGAPVAGAICGLDPAPGNILAGNRLYKTGDDGTAIARAPNLPARLRCAAPGAPYTPVRIVAPDESTVEIEAH